MDPTNTKENTPIVNAHILGAIQAATRVGRLEEELKWRINDMDRRPGDPFVEQSAAIVKDSLRGWRKILKDHEAAIASEIKILCAYRVEVG